MGGRRTINEHMTEVCATGLASNFNTLHSERKVLRFNDDIRVHAIVEVWPTAARVELFGRAKQFGAATHAEVFSFVVLVPIYTGKGALCSFFTWYAVLFFGEYLLLIFVALVHCCIRSLIRTCFLCA